MDVLSLARLIPKTPPPPAARLRSERAAAICIRPIWSRPPSSSLRRRISRFSTSAPGNGATESSPAEEDEEEEEKQKNEPTVEEERDPAATVAELKEIMAARRDKGGGGDVLGGVAEEVREIEWPAFGKVVGTTGVVLAVIAGSSVALLSVNAILAELSDRVFAGRGLQDFFG